MIGLTLIMRTLQLARVVRILELPNDRKVLGSLCFCLIFAACSPDPVRVEKDEPTSFVCDDHKSHPADYALVSGGMLQLGQDPHYTEELTSVRLHVDDLWFLSHEVTNSEFAEFMADTGYITDAERLAPTTSQTNGSAVFEPSASLNTIWRLDRTANWRAPKGKGSSLQGLEHHPVVHVSLADARAYANWANARLPTEIEWEYAAQSGLPDEDNTTSGAYDRMGVPLANTWQGLFPIANTMTDGHAGTSEVGCYGASKVGLYDMIGNVWEWTETPSQQSDEYTIKGGSYLCSDSFCRRYRPQARQFQALHFSSSHLGFRTVRDKQPD